MHYFLLFLLIYLLDYQNCWGQETAKFEMTSKDIEINREKQIKSFQYQIVTASRLQETSDKAPANVQVITQEQIQVRGYRSLLEILRDLGAFKIDDAATEEWWHNITLNGVERQDKIVILMDGLRISSATNEMTAYLENYPPQLARQIEIIYGPASALYGADAMTCVIHIITQEGKEEFSSYWMPYGDSYGARGGYGAVSVRLSANQSFTFGGQYSFDPQPNMTEIFSADSALDMTGHQTGIFQTEFGEIRTQEPVNPNYAAPLKNYATFAKLRLSDFNFTFFHNSSQISSSSGVKTQNAIYNQEHFIAQSITTFGAQYAKSYGKITSNTTLQGNWYEMNPLSNYRNVFTGMERGYKYAFSNRIKAEQQLTWKPSNSFSFIGGASYERYLSLPKTADLESPINRNNSIAGFYLGTDLSMQIFSITYTNIGSYAQFQYSPISWIHLTLGSRYDYNSRFGSTLNPRLGVVMQPTNQTTLKALFGSAFLAPLPFYSHGHYGSFYTEDDGMTYRSGFINAPNPNLKPLKLNTSEIQLQHIFKDVLSLRANAFYTKLTGLFVDVPDQGNTNLYDGKFLGWEVDYIQTVTNANEQENWGAGLRLDYQKTYEKINLTSWFSANYVDGRQRQQDENYYPVGLLSTWQYRAGADAKLSNFTASMRLIASNAQRLNALKPDSKERQHLKGYYLLNLTLRYRFWKDNFLMVDVRNLTNNRYYAPSRTGDKLGGYQLVGVPQWTRRIFLGLQMPLTKK